MTNPANSPPPSPDPFPALSGSFRNQQVWLAVGSLMILAAIASAEALVYTRGVMIPFVMAIMITTVVSPVVDYQVLRWRMPGWIAIAVAFSLVLAILALLGVVMLVAVQTVVRAAGEYSDRVVEISRRLSEELSQHHIHIEQGSITSELQSRLPGIITGTAGTVTTLLSSGFLILFFSVLLLVGRNPHRIRTGAYADIENTIRKYITTKTLISAVTGLLVGTVLWGFGLHMAYLFGLLAFLLNYIPSIGSIIATMLPIPIALTQFHDPWTIAAVVGVPGTIHMTIGNFIEPRLMGRDLELHPVTVLLALAFWGLLWGIMGMVLAVPIVAAFRLVLDRFETTRGLGNLLAGRLPGAQSAWPASSPPSEKS